MTSNKAIPSNTFTSAVITPLQMVFLSAAATAVKSTPSVSTLIPKSKAQLYNDAIDNIEAGIGIWVQIIAFFTDMSSKDGKDNENAEEKSKTAAEFKAAYVRRKAPDAKEGDNAYKAAMKNGGSYFATYVGRARNTIWPKPKVTPTTPVTPTNQRAATAQAGTASATIADDVAISIMASVREALIRAQNFGNALAKFQHYKLSPKQTADVGVLAEEFGKLQGVIEQLVTMITPKDATGAPMTGNTQAEPEKRKPGRPKAKQESATVQ